MAISGKPTSVLINASGIHVHYDNGVTEDYASVAEVEAACSQAESEQTMHAMILKWWLTRDPELTSQAIITGQIFTLDFAADDVFSIT